MYQKDPYRNLILPVYFYFGNILVNLAIVQVACAQYLENDTFLKKLPHRHGNNSVTKQVIMNA